jgi:hypothetical protein
LPGLLAIKGTLLGVPTCAVIHLLGPRTCKKQFDLETVCQKAYDETREYYQRELYPLLAQNKADSGFKILYGPLLYNPEILFIGYQPGGRRRVRVLEHYGPPLWCEYATAGWDLAAKLQQIFPPAALSRSNGMNQIFFRASDLRSWRASLNRQSRRTAHRFCLERAEKLLRALAPKRIVIIGLHALKPHFLAQQWLRSPSGRRLAEKGILWGVPAHRVIHLTGARISTADFNLIKQWL